MTAPTNAELLLVLNLLISDARDTLSWDDAAPIVDYLTARREQVLAAIADAVRPVEDVAIP